MGSVGVQACDVSLHQVPAEQSASTLHPPTGSHVPLTLQAPDRQTVPPLAAVQGPSPLAYPHSLSEVSQTPDVHTEVPADAVQTPVSGGVWPEIVGMGVPFASLGAHPFVMVLQNWVVRH